MFEIIKIVKIIFRQLHRSTILDSEILEIFVIQNPSSSQDVVVCRFQRLFDAWLNGKDAYQESDARFSEQKAM